MKVKRDPYENDTVITVSASSLRELCPTHPRNCGMGGHLQTIVSWFVLANSRVIGSVGISLHKINNPKTEISLRRTMTITSMLQKRQDLRKCISFAGQETTGDPAYRHFIEIHISSTSKNRWVLKSLKSASRRVLYKQDEELKKYNKTR